MSTTATTVAARMVITGLVGIILILLDAPIWAVFGFTWLTWFPR